MNLPELDKMLGELDALEDKELIEFYQRKRVELLEEIAGKVRDKLPDVNYITAELVDTIYKVSGYKTDVSFNLEILQVGSFKLQVERVDVAGNFKLQALSSLKESTSLDVVLEDNGVLYRLESVPNNNFCLTRVLCGTNTGKTQSFQEDDLDSVNVFLNVGQY